MDQDNKQRRHKLTEQLRLSITPDARVVPQLVEVMLDEAYKQLASADGNDMYRAQGVVRHLVLLHKQLTSALPGTQE